MSSDSPIKKLLMGKLDVIKQDDPTLIKEFMDGFQDIQIEKSAVWNMLFIRACHFGARKTVNHLLSLDLIKDLDVHDNGPLRTAIRNDNPHLINLLLDRGAKAELDGNHCALLAATHGAAESLPSLLTRARLQYSGTEFDALLGKITTELVKNAFSIPAEKIVNLLDILKGEGASLTGKNGNLLAIAIMANKESDMTKVVERLVKEPQSDRSILGAKATLQTLIDQMHAHPKLRDAGKSFEIIRTLRSTIGSLEKDHGTDLKSAKMAPSTMGF